LHCCMDVNEKKPSNKKSGYLGLLREFLETLGYVWFMMTCDHRLFSSMHTPTSCRSSNMPYKNNETTTTTAAAAATMMTTTTTTTTTTWSRALLEKPTSFQLVKKFSAFYRSQIFITIHKCPQPAPILNQLDPIHTLTSHFLKIHLNIILPSRFRVSQVVSFPQVFPPKTCICLSSPDTRYMPAHLILFDFIT